MTVERILPSPRLAPFIKEFVLIETEEEVCNKPLPDTSLVMSFRYKGHIQMQHGAIPDNLAATMVSGLRKSVRLFNYAKATGNLLVIFKECGMRAFNFGPIPAHELFDLHVSSENMFSPTVLNDTVDQLAEAKHKLQRIQVIETFLSDHLADNQPDRLIDHAVEQIKVRKGLVKIKGMASSLYISQDAFEKRFRMLVGCTPKQYASIVRLRHLIDQYPSYASLTAACHEAGYFDQSHFIKDFRSFTGETPRNFFAAARFW